MRVTLDRERDIAYIELEEPRRPYPDGGSSMLLPRGFPFRVDLVYDGDELLVEGDQCDEIGAPVADDERLRDPGLVLEQVLDVLRRDVLAAGGDDDVLLAAGDREEAVGVDLAHVARVQPAVAGEDRARRLLVLVVAGEDGWPLNEDFAVLGRRHLDAGD